MAFRAPGAEDGCQIHCLIRTTPYPKLVIYSNLEISLIAYGSTQGANANFDASFGEKVEYSFRPHNLNAQVGVQIRVS